MDRNQLKSYIQGPIATVPTAFDRDYEIDHGRMYELAQGWVDQPLYRQQTVKQA